MRVICQNIIIHVSLRIVLYNPRNQTLYSFFLLYYPYCKEIHNQGLMWGLDYVFPFLKNDLIQNFVMVKLLLKIIYTCSVARWLWMNLFTREN